MIPEASFLVWLDCTDLGMGTDELHQFFSLKAGLGLNKGTIFGAGGEYHLSFRNGRDNFGALYGMLKPNFKRVRQYHPYYFFCSK